MKERVVTNRIHPKSQEPYIPKFIVPAEFEKYVPVVFEEVGLETSAEVGKERVIKAPHTSAGRMLSQSIRSLDCGTRGVA